MSTQIKTSRILLAMLILFLIAWSQAEAQRMNHGSAGRSSSRPSAGSQPSINGGSFRSSSRTPSNQFSQNRVNQPGAGMNNSGARAGTSDRKVPGNNAGSGNRANAGNNKDVNINIDRDININNSHNTVVRRNNVAVYHRPPYHYGGRAYYCHHPYHYHPYHPFFWGPVWHPWGFVVATIAVTAIIVNYESQQYYYDQGVYYVKSSGGYTVVAAPVGSTVTTLPPETQTVVVNETTNNYYYGGTYYEKSDSVYKVVAPTAGTIVENLPEGGEEVKIGEQTYVKIGETYYQPIEKDGKNMYEVVQIEEDKKSG
jgi:hypothetical protein